MRAHLADRSRRSRRSGASVVALALLVLPACSALPDPATARTPVVVPSPTPLPSLASNRPDGRPLEPVPAVRPTGFTTPPPGLGLDRYRRQPLSWTTCRQVLQCATVKVPLDYAHPDQTAITLALARHPATGATPRGSLFINPGGPGGSGVSYVDYFNRTGLEDYNIVGWDPRGVGASTPVECEGGAALDRYFSVDVSPDNGAEQTALLDSEKQFGASCLARSGALLEHVSTTETVRDLDLLRGLVGEDKLSYFGSSYGTQIGSLYAQLFPDHVGRMVLDGAVDITAKPSVVQIEGFERALGSFAAWSAAHKTPLGSSEEEVLQTVTDLLHGLDLTPLPVAGRTLSQQQGVAAVVFSMYGGRDGWRVLEQGLYAAVARQDGAILLQIADRSNERSTRGTYGQVTYAFPAVRCLDQAEGSLRKALQQWQDVAQKAPILGRLGGPNLTCPSWPVVPAPRPPEITGEGAPPIVVIGTTGDPATPYEYAQGMAQQLVSGVLVTLQGEGHLAYAQSACIRQVVDRYLVQGQVPADGTRCAS